MKLVLRLLWQNAKRHKGLAIATVILILLTTALWIAEPLYAAYAIDKLIVLADGEVPDFLFIFGIWIGLFLLLSVVRGCEKFVMWQSRNVLKMDRREDVYERLMQLDMDFHIRQKTGESIQILEDGADEIRWVQSMILDLIPAILASVIFLVISLFVQPLLAVILYVGIALFVFVSVFLSTKTAALQDKVNKLWISAIGRANDAMTNIYAVKSSAMEGRELAHMRQENKQALDEQRRINKRWAIMEAVNFYMLIRILLIAVGVVLLGRGELTLGQLYFFQFTFFRALTPFEMMSNFLPEWNKSVGKIRMAQEILEKPVHVKSPAHPKTLSALKGEVRFDHVSFTYGADIDTIKDISLDVKPGEHIAFVGHSGAGKSTMAALINRFYDVTDGSITVDGVDLREFDLQWWRSRIGLVLQENITFNDSIFENIRYSRPSATKEEVIEAAQRASAHDFISSLPQGYETLVGERGIRLSGGERQRVAIARAILKKPSIVVLDEATSALDSITERAVQEGIKELIKGRTSFIIAHRLSTVRSVDRIAVMDGGRLIACATHEELLKISPVYKEMVELQHGGLLAE